MAERLNAPVLKTGGAQVLGGSNPPPSASAPAIQNFFGTFAAVFARINA